MRSRPRAGRGTNLGMHSAAGLIDALASGDLASVAARLADGIHVDDPREGRVSGRAAAERWLADEHAWLAGLSARPAPLRGAVGGRAAVVESLLAIDVDGEPAELPMALAAEEDQDGRLVAVRLYHSFWPVERCHHPRGRVLPARAGLALRPPIDAYQRALAAGDVDAILACYERGASVREPAGGPFVHRGARGLRRLYGGLLWDGGLSLDHGNVVDDGVVCAIEYTVVGWGRRALPAQGGLVVYERGRSGLIRATRIYDDVDPPRD